MEIRLLGDIDSAKVKRGIAAAIKNPPEEAHEGGRLNVYLVSIHSAYETLRGKPRRADLVEIEASGGSEDRSALAITKVLVKKGFHVRIRWQEGRSPDEYGPENDYIPSELE